jgi:sugar-specific transcriptional regulator TrmB
VQIATAIGEERLREEDIKTLMDLGLTLLQAKTFLAVIELGEASNKAIAKTSKVARQNIYQIMLSLQEKGLVEKILEKPIKFRALPLKEAAEKLFRDRTDEYLKVKAETQELIEKPENVEVPEKIHDFVFIPEKEAHCRRIWQAFDAAQRSIHTIMTYVGEPEKDDLPAPLLNAISRGVKVKVISNVPEKVQVMTPVKRGWTKEDTYEVRYVRKPLPVMFCSVDKKELFLAADPKPDPNCTKALWTNNVGLVTMAEDFFRRTWRKAAPPLQNVSSADKIGSAESFCEKIRVKPRQLKTTS